MSKRQSIVAAVKTRMSTVRTANGYQTEIGASQTEWHPTAKGVDELPSHDVRDEFEEAVVTARNKGLYERKLRVTLIAELVEADATATNARKAHADIVRAVGVDPTWGGLAKYSVPAEEEVTVDEEGQRIGAVRVSFDVVYFRRAWEA